MIRSIFFFTRNPFIWIKKGFERKYGYESVKRSLFFCFLGKIKQRSLESYDVPEELKLSFHEDLLSNPKEEEDGVTETDGFDLRSIWFLGKFKPKLRPKSSFSNIIFVKFSQEKKKKTEDFSWTLFCTKFFCFPFRERERERKDDEWQAKEEEGLI